MSHGPVHRVLGRVAAACAGATALIASAGTTQLDIKVSKDGINWSPSVTVTQGWGESNHVYVAYVVSYIPSTGEAAPNAFASLNFQPVFSGVRLGIDTIAPFLTAGTNVTGGAIDSRTSYLHGTGSYGRIKPWANTGVTTSQPYSVFTHIANSGGAPNGNYYRIARSDITRWMGTGLTTGTTAINNFTGLGGIAVGQKQTPTAGVDPARVSGSTGLVLMVLELDVGPSPQTGTVQILATAPIEGMTRNTTTGAREASWWANTSENIASVKGTVTVNGGEIVVSCNAPLITTQPAPQTICAGGSVTLNIAAIGPGLSYQWRKDGQTLSGESGTSLSLANLGAAAAGNYDCIVSNQCQSVTSSSTPVVVGVAPSVTEQPASLAACTGAPAQLSFGLSGIPTPSVQWRKGGVSIAGATSPILTFASVSAADSDSYDCVATNLCGTVTTASATLSISDGTYPVITTQPTSRIACTSRPTTFSVAATASGVLSYQWRKGGVAIDGATGASYTFTAGSSDAGTYDCLVSNGCGTLASAAATLQLAGSFTTPTNPSSQSVAAGTRVTFTTSTTGGPGITYQWIRSGAVLANGGGVTGVDTATLTIASAAAKDQGAYQCIVGNGCDTPKVTVAATLTLTPCTQTWATRGASLFDRRWVHGQAFDSVSGGTILFGGRDVNGLTKSDTWLLRNGVWSQLAVSGPGARSDHAMVSVGSTGVLLFGGKSTLADATCFGDTWLWNGSSWVQVSSTGPAPRGGHSMVYDSRRGRVVLFGGFGADSLVLADTWEWDGAAWVRVAAGATSPDARFAAAMAYDGVNGKTVLFGGYNDGTKGDTWTWDGAAWVLAASGGPPARYYASAAMFSPIGRVMLFGGVDTALLNDVWTWSGTAWSVRTFSGTVPAARWTHAMSMDESVGRMVITGGAGIGLTRFRDTVEVTDRPMITLQPRDTALCLGGSVTLNVAATGPGTITYIWQKNGVSLANQTAATLTLPNVSIADIGTYTCVVSNTCGAVVTTSSAVTLFDSVTIRSDPAAQALCEGETAVLTVDAGGTPPLSYQWRKAGVAVAGATSASLSVPVQASTAGVYDCVVTNPCGSRTTAGAQVAVGVAPAVTTGPVSASVLAGAPAQFSVVATGLPVPTFQWRRNGSAIAGATSATLLIAAAQYGDQGLYDCVVTNRCGRLTTGAASLSISVCPPVFGSLGSSPFGPRSGHGQAFDGINLGTLLFGGRDASGVLLDDAWLLQNNVWAPITVVGGPSARADAAMVTLANGHVLLFGGQTPGGLSGETWEWSGASWSQLAMSGPSARCGHAMAFDAIRNKAVLFGGVDGSGALLADTWEWNGSGWTARAAGGPSARFGHAMGCDPVSGNTVMFGGNSGAVSGETWLWDGSVWTIAAGSGPAARAGTTLVFDPLLGSLVLFGGWGGLNDCWRWASGAWTQLSLVAGPTARGGHAASFDTSAGLLVITGGEGAVALDDTWELSGTPVIVRQPDAAPFIPGRTASLSVGAFGPNLTYQWRRAGSVMTNSARVSGANSPMLSIGSVHSSDQALYDCVISNGCGAVASQQVEVLLTTCNPTWRSYGDGEFGPRSQHRQAFDGVSQSTLMFGGYNATGGVLGDTRIWGGGAWQVLTTPTAPSARAGFAMATLADGHVLLFGGKMGLGASQVAADTWEWSGTAWSQRASTGPSARTGHDMVFDSIRGRVVMFGGVDAAGVTLADTWEWNGTAWARVAITGPTARAGHAMAFDPIRARTVMFGGLAGVYRGDTWEWSGSAWVQGATGGPAARTGAGAAYDAVLGRVLVFGGRNASSTFNDCWVWRGTSWQSFTPPQIPGARSGMSMSFDQVAGRMMVAGGELTNGTRLADTWQLAGDPLVLTQPVDQQVRAGASLALSVAATGSSPLGYRWLKDGFELIDDARISGTRTSDLAIGATTPADSGLYRVIVENGCGGTSSLDAVVVVTEVVPCIGDYNQDGGIGGDDVDAFFADWESGNSLADVNLDGGVDSADVDEFFVHWEGGC